MPDDIRKKYLDRAEQLKAEYLEANSEWNAKLVKSGKAEALQTANDRLKAVKSKTKPTAEPAIKKAEKKPKAAKSSEKAKSPAKDKQKD